MNRHPLVFFILISVSLTMFLFYIDEGYYNFNWMKDPGNWIAFLIYILPMFGIQILIYYSVVRNFRLLYRYILSSIGGIVLTLGLLLSFFHFIQKI